MAQDAVGAVENPPGVRSTYGSSDVHRFEQRLATEFFVDVFNLFNDRRRPRLEDRAAGTGTTPYLGEIAWVQPRRAFIGARVRF